MQEEALTEVVQAKPGSLLMVLLAGAGKTLLFMARAALLLALVTVVIVPYLALKVRGEQTRSSTRPQEVSGGFSDTKIWQMVPHM